MPWKYRSDDLMVGVVVDPIFRGDLISLASLRPLWVVRTEHNRPLVEMALSIGADANLFEVTIFSSATPEDRLASLREVFPLLDEEYGLYRGFFSYGLAYSSDVGAALHAEGFRLGQVTGDGFVALMDPSVRGKVIGREYPDLPRLD